jgi:hypothetical protein
LRGSIQIAEKQLTQTTQEVEASQEGQKTKTATPASRRSAKTNNNVPACWGDAFPVPCCLLILLQRFEYSMVTEQTLPHYTSITVI